MELLGGVLALLFTLGILSYVVLGNQPLFRTSVAVWVGIASGYGAAVVLREFLLPALRATLNGQGNGWLPWLLGLLLLFYATRWRSPARWTLGLLLGIGAAVLLAGALFGTLFPQVVATWREWAGLSLQLSFVQGITAWFLVLTVVSAFYLGNPQNLPSVLNWPLRGMQTLGWVVVIVTLAVLSARVYQAALFALLDRLVFLWDFMRILLQGM